ncbi:MAG TPA: hypothetical protein VK151_16415 [Fluviicola sp.]|nr:hypothetical protein [Fluviicola sp.]
MIATRFSFFTNWCSNLAIYLSKDRHKNNPAKNLLQKTKISTFNWLRFSLLLGFVAYLISFLFFIFDVLHQAFAFPSNNLNFKHQQELVKARVPDSEVKPLYFNDNYFFWEVISADSSKTIIVTEFDKLVGDTIPFIEELETPTEEDMEWDME